jgi:hypothetical protein
MNNLLSFVLILLAMSSFNAFLASTRALHPSTATSLRLSRVKLPIVQIYEGGVRVHEYIIGNNMTEFLPQLEETLSERRNIDAAEGYVENLYSDDMLQDAIAEAKEKKTGTFVLKIYRDGCKKCAALEEKLWYTAPSEFKRDDTRWLSVESSYIPEHINELKDRLLDKPKVIKKLPGMSKEPVQVLQH